MNTQYGEFAYAPLQPNSIRLLYIEHDHDDDGIHLGILENAPYVQNKIRYTALSYCWGDPRDTREVNLHGRSFYVTVNLYAALKAIAAHHVDRERVEYLWIDAVCINQQEIEERNEQVAQMWRIFSRAERVLAWIGPTDDTADAAFATLNAISGELTSTVSRAGRSGWQDIVSGVQHIDIVKDKELPIIHDLRTKYGTDEPSRGQFSLAIHHLLDREYLTRVWMITELVQAQSLIFLCGPHAWCWETLDLYIYIFADRTRKEALLPPPLYARTSYHERLDNRAKSTTLDMIHTLTAFARAKCTDKRDTIFAVLGHPVIQALDSKMLLKPDYSLTVYELAIVALEWMDRICVIDEPSTALLRIILKWLEVGLGVKVDQKTFREWVDGHEDWRLQEELGLGNGRVVKCTGQRMRYLLTGS